MINQGGGYMLIASHIDNNSAYALNELDDETKNNASRAPGQQESNVNNPEDELEYELFPQFVSEDEVSHANIYKLFRWKNSWNNMKSI